MHVGIACGQAAQNQCFPRRQGRRIVAAALTIVCLFSSRAPVSSRRSPFRRNDINAGGEIVSRIITRSRDLMNTCKFHRSNSHWRPSEMLKPVPLPDSGPPPSQSVRGVSSRKNAICSTISSKSSLVRTRRNNRRCFWTLLTTKPLEDDTGATWKCAERRILERPSLSKILLQQTVVANESRRLIVIPISRNFLHFLILLSHIDALTSMRKRECAINYLECAPTDHCQTA
jgi:hypothetical protein